MEETPLAVEVESMANDIFWKAATVAKTASIVYPSIWS